MHIALAGPCVAHGGVVVGCDKDAIGKRSDVVAPATRLPLVGEGARVGAADLGTVGAVLGGHVAGHVHVAMDVKVQCGGVIPGVAGIVEVLDPKLVARSIVLDSGDLRGAFTEWGVRVGTGHAAPGDVDIAVAVDCHVSDDVQPAFAVVECAPDSLAVGRQLARDPIVIALAEGGSGEVDVAGLVAMQSGDAEARLEIGGNVGHEAVAAGIVLEHDALAPPLGS